MALTTARLNTTGMHCGSCAMLIDMTLGDLEGVDEARTDLASGQTVVSYDDSALTVDQIVEAVRGAGYEAEPAE